MKILVLDPHYDDSILGCGGTIASLARSHEIYFMVMSECFYNGVLRKEFDNAAQILAPNAKILYRDYRVRNFNIMRQAILDDLYSLRKYGFNMVFCPCSYDIHQDHHVVYEEAMRAFKNITIWGYELPWNTLSVSLNGHRPLLKTDINLKINALRCFESQSNRKYMNPDFIYSWARTRGICLNGDVEVSESFEIINHIL